MTSPVTWPQARWPYGHKAKPAAAVVRNRRRVGRGNNGSVIVHVIGWVLTCATTCKTQSLAVKSTR